MSNDKSKIRMQRLRLNEKLEKEASASKDPSNINFEMKPIVDSFISQEDWLSANPDKTKTDYIHFKIAWQKETSENERDFANRELKEISQFGNLVQLNPKTKYKCAEFRKAWMTQSPNLGHLHQGHNCVYCDIWIKKYKETTGLGGVNLW